MTFALKQYQSQSLDKLRQYLLACSPYTARTTPAQAFAQWNAKPYQPRFGDAVPCVCLRVPTGGGKTLMAAHAVAIAGQTLLHTDAPVALWLTPSDTIRRQTIEAFQDPRHPYRLALTEHFGDRVRVCDLDSLQTVGPHDVGQSAIVVISTIQSLSVRKTSDRNVYSFFEALSPHFEKLAPNATQGLERVSEADLQKQPYLTAADVGRVKHSVANWLHLQKPVVIVDEAHNHQTETFFNAIGRLNPSCVVEFTATPVKGINVLHHVSAQELKAEQMVKLPIVLTEHPQGWQECLHDARTTRDKLELLAQKEPDYLRPIALIQAEDKNGTATVEVVRQYLEQDEQIPAKQIAVVTGTQKELDGINLFEPDCPVRYVITVEALKEGWDCSFAYVLASLQSVRSAKDVEQLLGRVLRMPYARNREQDALNRAYAHIVAESFAEAAHNITDRMVQNMGFNPFEAASLFTPDQGHLALDNPNVNKAPAPWPSFQVNLPAMPSETDMAQWPAQVRELVQVRPTTQGATLLLPGHVSDATLTEVQACVSAPLPAAEQASVHEQFEVQRTLREAQSAPAMLGVEFAPLPQLCLALEGHLEVVDRTALANMGHLDLLAERVQLAQFAIQDTSKTFEIDVQADGDVQYHFVDAQQSLPDTATTTLSEADLVRWLDREVRQSDIGQLQMQKWLLKMVGHLQHERNYSIEALVRARFALVPALLGEIDRLRGLAASKGFQQSLPLMTLPDPHKAPECCFRFEPGIYPARNAYRGGSYRFTKHFYGSHLIHDLQERTPKGELSEEFLCARAIDTCPQVKHWIRNIERQEQTSFWFATATDYFYPDFVAELNDGRVLVIEYKGENLWDTQDSKEKRLIGQRWQDEGKGKYLFLMTRKTDELGRDIADQLAKSIQERQINDH